MKRYDYNQPWENSASHINNENYNNYFYAFMANKNDCDYSSGTYDEQEAAAWIRRKRAEGDEECFIAVLENNDICIEEIG